jgi:hypothetical protein
MPVSTTTLQRLADLELSTEAFQEVLSIIADAVRIAELNATVSKNKQKSARNVGLRLSADWTLSHAGLEFAAGHGMTRHQIEIEIEKFRNYWTAKSGRDAVKLDWDATWRNWVLRSLENRNENAGIARNTGTHPVPRSPTAGADAVLAGMARIARRIVEKRNATRSRDGKVADSADLASEFDFE